MKNYVLARTTPLSRARKTLPSFDQAFDKLLANIEGFDVAKVRYDDIQRTAMVAAVPAERVAGYSTTFRSRTMRRWIST